jgi:hypothetical protein
LVIKCQNILVEGKYIGFRQYYNYMVNLYLYNETFYEAWYFRPTNVLERISILESEKDLDLYILSMNRENGNKIT